MSDTFTRQGLTAQSVQEHTIVLVFEKRKSFYCEVHGMEIGGKTQICLPHRGFGVTFKEDAGKLCICCRVPLFLHEESSGHRH